MIDLAAFSKIVVSLFVIVDPIGTIPVFLSTTEKWATQRRARAARIAAVTVFVVLSLTALLGEQILNLFGISLASFSVGAGILLLMLAISMLQAQISALRQTPEEVEEAIERNELGAVPLLNESPPPQHSRIGQHPFGSLNPYSAVPFHFDVSIQHHWMTLGRSVQRMTDFPFNIQS